MDESLPALKDISPEKPGKQALWLVAAKQELPEEAVREQALLQRAKKDDQGQTRPVRKRGRPL